MGQISLLNADKAIDAMRQYTCCFTGHRTIESEDLPSLIKRLDNTIAALIAQGVVFYGSGMATGWDTMAANAVLRAREQNSAVKLIAVLPCTNQDEHWNESDRKEYHRLLKAADKIVVVSERLYYNGCMRKRNQHLVEHSGTCIAYMKRGRSGTAQTVRMAQERGLRIINLAE